MRRSAQYKYTRFILLTVAVALAACRSTPTIAQSNIGTTNSKNNIELVDFVPSPDGHLIAFQYKDPSLGRNYVGIGLLNWQTGSLKRIPNPPEKQLSEPSFSYDGKLLAVGEGTVGSMMPTQIGSVDLDTMKFTEISSSTVGVKQYPVFQPGTKNVLYVDYQNWNTHRLILINRSTGEERIVLEGKNGFLRAILRPSFIAQNQIIFQATAPLNTETDKYILPYGLSAVAVAYRLDFGGSPKIFSIEAEKNTYLHVIEGAFDSISASQNGSAITYISSAPNVPVDSKTGIRNREIYKLDNGRAVAMTNTLGFKAGARVAYDGSVISFAANPNRSGRYDLFILKTSSGEIASTNLIDKITNDPIFSLK